MNKMKIIVFDDVPCWANTSGITRFLNRCLQAPNKCKGVLFIVTSNDGWCQDTYCNADPELDDRFVGFLEQLQKNVLIPLNQERIEQGIIAKSSGALSSAISGASYVIENRCKDIEQFSDEGGWEYCSQTPNLTKEECEHRGCCCLNFDTREGEANPFVGSGSGDEGAASGGG